MHTYNIVLRYGMYLNTIMYLCIQSCDYIYLCMSAEARQDSVHALAMSDSNYADNVNVNDVIMFSPYPQTPASISATCNQHWTPCQIESGGGLVRRLMCRS